MTDNRIREIYDEELRWWERGKLAVADAARDRRDLNDIELRNYEAAVEQLDRLAAERRDLQPVQPAARALRKTPAPNPTDPKDRLRHDRLEMLKIQGEQTGAAIDEHDRRMRTRELAKHLTAAEVQQAAADREVALAHQARMGELMKASIRFADNS